MELGDLKYFWTAAARLHGYRFSYRPHLVWANDLLMANYSNHPVARDQVVPLRTIDTSTVSNLFVGSVDALGKKGGYAHTFWKEGKSRLQTMARNVLPFALTTRQMGGFTELPPASLLSSGNMDSWDGKADLGSLFACARFCLIHQSARIN